MGKDTETDPNEGLADDASLATDLGDEDARRAEQLEYYGGDPDEDDDDLTALDRGDSVIADDDDGEEESDDDESEEESEESEEDDSDESEEGSDDDESDDASEDEDADEGDQDDSESDEDESEDDESADEVEEEEEEEDDKPKDKGIPRRRFNEVNTRMKNAESELAQLRAEKTAESDATEEKFDFDGAEDEYMALLLDGKTKEAGAKRREIREAEKADFKAEAVAESTNSISKDATEEALNTLTKEAEAMFPAFNEDSEHFNPEAVSKTLTFMRGYQAGGMKADDAFVAAVADSMEMFDLGKEQADKEPEPKPKKKGKKVTKKAPINKTKQKIKTSEQQGKTPAGEGQGSDEAGAVVPDIDQMSDEELDALPEKTLARMRGDII